MITSDKQLEASKQQLAMLQQSLIAPVDENITEVVRNASKVQLQNLIDDVQKEIADYERLKSAGIQDIQIHSVDDLLVAPIRYRIASHMSVDAFSRKVEVSARQIHRYEAESYKNVNTSTLTKILEKLNLHINGRVIL